MLVRQGESAPASHYDRIWTLFSVVGLAVLAFIGYIKGAPVVESSPIDLTLIGVATVATVVFTTAPRLMLIKGVAPLALLYIALLVGAVPIGSSTPYSTVKVQQIVLLVPICLLGGRLVLGTEPAREAWLRVVVILGGIIAALTLVFPDAVAAKSGRLLIEEGNTIGSARGIGAALTVLAVWMLCGTRRRFVSLLAVVVFVGILLLIGSRGPILAAGVAITAATLLSRQPGRSVRMLFVTLGGGVTGWIAISQTEHLSRRLFTLQDDSSDVRRNLWSETLVIARDHPLGIGWGQLYSHMDAGLGADLGVRQYPHNLLLEIISEAGWVTGVVTLIVIGYALLLQRRATITTTETGMFALLIFALVSSMVSGDIPSNREVWVAVGAAMVGAGRVKRELWWPTANRGDDPGSGTEVLFPRRKLRSGTKISRAPVREGRVAENTEISGLRSRCGGLFRLSSPRDESRPAINGMDPRRSGRGQAARNS